MTTTAVTIIRDNHGETDVHAAGCKDLHKSKYYAGDGWTITVGSLDDITYELWGESGVATDDYVGPTCFTPGATDEELAAFRAYTIENFTGCHKVFPCVTFPKGA